MPTTDPTFYRSPGDAVAAAPEQLAYVAAFDPTSQQKDALAVVDCDPESTTFGGVVGWTELPTSGNELHHFGWNACSSALCHEGHGQHEALERRYLLVPGLRSSTTYVLDTKPDPRHPVVTHTIEASELAAKAGYSRPHTVHCGPGRHLHVGVGWDRRRRRSRRRSSDRPRHVRGHRNVGAGPGTATLGVRRLVASAVRHRDHIGVGDTVDDREWAESRGLARTQVWTPCELLEHVRTEADPARRPWRRSTRWCSSCARPTTRPKRGDSSTQ